MRQCGSTVTVGRRVGDVKQALAEARGDGAHFLIQPEIQHWADHLTEWSGRSDRVTIRIQVYEAMTGNLLDTRRIEATSRWASLGGDHPQDLLPALSDQWADRLCIRPS